MRKFVVAVSLVALSGTAVAQEATGEWEFFESEGGRNGANVRAADGSQIVLKCDKPGRREVHAIILAPADARFAVPNDRAISRPITFQFDGAAPKTESWGFYEKYAISQGKTADRALARFVVDLRKASTVKLRMSTGIGSDIPLEFNVTGADAAIKTVYEKCKDTPPT